MSIIIHQINAFTDKPFAGNPAGVCVLEKPANELWMQSVAREMSLPETAFLYREDGNNYNLRWFTPTVEADLCGHATLASAHVLWETGALEPDKEAMFDTRSGILSASKKKDRIELDFPKEEAEVSPVPDNLAEALGAKPIYAGKNRFDYILELGSEKEVREIQPDFNLLKKVPMRGVIVTSVSDSPDYDFVSRFFAPSAGIDEDPVTGSAHCCLGPYWEKRLKKSEFYAYQASDRGGELSVRIDGERVILGGHAVTVLECELVV